MTIDRVEATTFGMEGIAGYIALTQDLTVPQAFVIGCILMLQAVYCLTHNKEEDEEWLK